jgi:DNA polymerase I-like protein with 3'-5' exonuclease and polymerase domains
MEKEEQVCSHQLKRFPIATLSPYYAIEHETLCILCGAPAHKIKICKCTKQPLSDCPSCSGTGKVKGIAQAKCPCTNRAIADPNCSKCFGSSLYTGSEMRWAKLVPFNVGSSKQMMNYAKFRGYRIPMNSKRKIAMDSETVAKLAKSTGDPLYVHTQKHRVIGKIKSSYADSWLEKLQNPSLLAEPNNERALVIEEAEREWHARIKESGLATIHTSFQFRPATKQLSSKGPNIQVKPSTKHVGFRAELATMFGEAVEAPAGHTLVEFDYRSFHALTLGYEARDSSYIRLARLDAHSFLCANMLHLQGSQDCLALPDEELREYLKYVKKNFEKERNSQAKPAILGYGFGMGARKLYDLNQDSFRDVEEAKYVIDMLNACFPKCAAYRNDSPELAHRQMYLISPHKCIRWFCDVKKWNSEKQRWNHGKDWEKSIAFRPANIAFCVIQQRMIDMLNNGMAAKYNLINNIHDALLFCPKTKDLEQCASDVKHLLEASDATVTDPEGKALWCEVEVKAGSNWAKMQDLKV